MEKTDIERQCPLFKGKCMEDSCAWYMKDEASCSILVLANELREIEISTP